jgi:hypothetical protein
MARFRRSVSVLVAGAVVLCGCSFGVTGASDELTDVSARVSGVVGSAKPDTVRWWFEYGITSAYANRTPHRSLSIASSSTRVAVSETMSGLSEGTTYHYRLCTLGSDDNGGCGADATFTTTSGQDSVSGQGVVLDLGFGAVWGASTYAVADGASAGAATGNAAISPGSVYFRIADAGNVTCLRIVGNRAAVGFIGKAVDLGQPNPQPTPRVLYVEDNGPTSDRIGFGSLSEPYSDCPTPTDARFPNFVVGDTSVPPVLQTGNFIIHDHASS